MTTERTTTAKSYHMATTELFNMIRVTAKNELIVVDLRESTPARLTHTKTVNTVILISPAVDQT